MKKSRNGYSTGERYYCSVQERPVDGDECCRCWANMSNTDKLTCVDRSICVSWNRDNIPVKLELVKEG